MLQAIAIFATAFLIVANLGGNKAKKEKHVTDNDSDFLLYHVPSLLSHIKDDALRTSNPWLEK